MLQGFSDRLLGYATHCGLLMKAPAGTPAGADLRFETITRG